MSQLRTPSRVQPGSEVKCQLTQLCHAVRPEKGGSITEEGLTLCTKPELTGWCQQALTSDFCSKSMMAALVGSTCDQGPDQRWLIGAQSDKWEALAGLTKASCGELLAQHEVAWVQIQPVLGVSHELVGRKAAGGSLYATPFCSQIPKKEVLRCLGRIIVMLSKIDMSFSCCARLDQLFSKVFGRLCMGQHAWCTIYAMTGSTVMHHSKARVCKAQCLSVYHGNRR